MRLARRKRGWQRLSVQVLRGHAAGKAAPLVSAVPAGGGGGRALELSTFPGVQYSGAASQRGQGLTHAHTAELA